MGTKTLRIIFDHDNDADLSHLEQWNTPAKYMGNEVLENGKKVPFVRYMNYWGNPDRHVNLCMIVQEQCDKCEQWHTVDSLGSIDFMDDQDYQTGTFYNLSNIKNAYQLELAIDSFKQNS